MKKLSIVILNYKTRELTKNCIESVLKNVKGLDYEIVVVDNNSADGSYEFLKERFSKFKHIKLVQSPKNLGFSAGNNLGIRKTNSEYVLLLNSDTLVLTKTINQMISWMDKNPEIGISTCSLKELNNKLQGNGGYFPNLLRVAAWMTIEDLPGVSTVVKPFHPMKKTSKKSELFFHRFQTLDWVTGAFLLTRKKVFDQIGLLDEDYFMYTEDTDFCYRAKKAGWKIVYNPKWFIIHLGGASSTSEFAILSEYKGVKIFYQKHYPSWQYPILRIFLKIGALLRMIVFGITEGTEAFQIYAKAYRQA